MPAINSGKVLVTGASGYIGAWIVKYLVEHGFTVVVAVRNDEQGVYIVNRFPEYKGKVSYINIPDIQKDGAYDEAVKGVDAIVHGASPVVFSWEDPSEVVGPAIGGAVEILKSAQKYGTNVKRIILTSSSVAIHNGDYDGEQKPNTNYDETEWNTVALNAQLTKDSSPWLVYNAAKTKAEKAAWDFVANQKPLFDLVAVLPTYNFGPYIHKVDKSIASTPGMLLSTFPAGETSGKLVGDFVDVRDSAILHVLALENEALGGERLISGNGIFAWQDIYDILNAAGYDAPGKDAKGAGAKKQNTLFSNAKTFKYFSDFKYHTLEESVKDMGADFKKSGLIQYA